MAKKGTRLANLTVNNGSVVVYYHKGSTMKLPTGVIISKKKAKNGKFLEWDYKRQTLSADAPDFATRHSIIQAALIQANDILDDNAKNGIFLSGAELEKILVGNRTSKQIIRYAELLKMYRQFYEEKKIDLGANGKIISIKDYTSFMNMIIDYEKVHGITLKIVDVDANFLKKLHNWLRLKCPPTVETPDGIHHLVTKGKLGAKTLRKRFDIFKEFYRYLQVNKFIADYEFIKDYTKKNLPNVKTIKVTLTIDEVYKLYDYKFETEKLNNIKQLFTFACLTGMRWGDLESFDERFINYRHIKPIYSKRAQKTANSSAAIVELPLCETAMEILKNNGNNLKSLMLSNVKANEYIKEALQKTGYFDEITNLIDKETGENLRRYEAITMHKGRDTFITNLVNVTPLNELMKYTGHKKLSTLQQYIDQTRTVSHKYIDEAFHRPNK